MVVVPVVRAEVVKGSVVKTRVVIKTRVVVGNVVGTGVVVKTGVVIEIVVRVGVVIDTVVGAGVVIDDVVSAGVAINALVGAGVVVRSSIRTAVWGFGAAVGTIWSFGAAVRSASHLLAPGALFLELQMLLLPSTSRSRGVLLPCPQNCWVTSVRGSPARDGPSGPIRPLTMNGRPREVLPSLGSPTWREEISQELGLLDDKDGE